MKGTSSDPNIGQLLINRYELSGLIGKGQWGGSTLQKIPCWARYLLLLSFSPRLFE